MAFDLFYISGSLSNRYRMALHAAIGTRFTL